MPAYPPRDNSTKKREQLLKRKQELQHAIRVAAPHAQLAKVVEKLRAAQLSLLKADLYWMRGSQTRNFQVTGLSDVAQARIVNIQEQMKRWESRTVDEILSFVSVLEL